MASTADDRVMKHDGNRQTVNNPSQISQAFKKLGRPLPRIKDLTTGEIKTQAARRSTNIVQTWTTLREVVLRHEATIQRRWLKKTKARRLEVLLNAWPNMPAHHRPDFEAYRNECQRRRESGNSACRQKYLWPYLNQEDLCKPRSLLLFLNARGRNLPSAFAAADAEGLRFGLGSRAVPVVCLDDRIMILNGVTESNMQDYGKLVAWDGPGPESEGCDWDPLLRQFLPGIGLLVLEVQERILAFLLSCCRDILHDIPEDSWISEAFPVQPEPQLKAESKSAGFESVTVMAAEAPYRVPAQIEWHKLVQLLRTRLAAAEDQFWALREDPVHLFNQLLETKEHRRPEMLVDSNGKRHPLNKRLQENGLWKAIVSGLLTEVTLQLEDALVSPHSKEVSEGYLKPLLMLRTALVKACNLWLELFKVTAPPSPPLRPFFTRCASDTTCTAFHLKEGVTRTKHEAWLLLMLEMLWEDGHILSLPGLHTTVDEIDRLVQAEPEAGRLISPYISGLLGDLSLIAHCLYQVEDHCRYHGVSLSDIPDEIEDKYRERAAAWLYLLELIRPHALPNRIAREVIPFKQRFSYPVEKRRTRETVEALREVESNLDIFWDCVDEHILKNGLELNRTATGFQLSLRRDLQRTPRWIEQFSLRNSEEEHEASESDQTDFLYKPLSTLYFGSEASSEQTKKKDPTKSRTKVKTRGTVQPRASSTNTVTRTTKPITNPATPKPAPQPPIPVDARALKVFRSLFHDPDINSTPGEIAWTDFLHAMASTGFEIQKLQGSVWHFQPTRFHVEKAIQFHEPHPKGKMAYWVARRYGRRLQRAYGWDGGMFCLRVK